MKFILTYGEFITEAAGTPATLYAAKASGYLSAQLGILKSIQHKKYEIENSDSKEEKEKLKKEIEMLKQREAKVVANMTQKLSDASTKIKKMPQYKRDQAGKFGENERKRVDRLKAEIIKVKQRN